VTRDVVLDLLPLYFAGQVSADTKTLVEEFLRTDPDFARMSQRFDSLLKERGDAPTPPEIERKALERTRALLRSRNQTIGMAIGYSLAPFIFIFRDGRVDWILWQRPKVAIAFLFTGLACWITAFVIGRRARL
jgi:hypothetical protein